MAAIEELVATLGLETDASSFVAGFAKLESLHAAFEVLFEAAKEVGKAILELVPSTAEAAIAAERAAQKTGTTAAAFQEMSFAAEQVDVSADTLQHSMILLARQANSAALGGKEAEFAFRQLGVGVFGANGQIKPTDQLLGDLSERFASMPDGVRKTALATQVFGRAGAELIPLLNKGKAGIQELRDAAYDYGVVLDEDAIAAAKRWEEQQKHLSAALKGLKFAIGSALLKQMGDLVDKVADWIRANRELIAGKVVEFFKSMMSIGEVLIKTIDALFIKTEAWKYSLLALTAVLAFMNLPLLAIVGAFLLIEDFYYFLQGKDSLIGRMFPKAEREAILEFMQTVKAFFSYLFSGQLGDDIAKGQAGQLNPSAAFAKNHPMLNALTEGGNNKTGLGMFSSEGIAGAFNSLMGHSGSQTVVQQTNHTTVNVHPPPGTDEKQIADNLHQTISDHHDVKMREGMAHAR